MGKGNHTKTLVLSALLAAIIFLITFLLPFRIPGTSAYVNIGDSMIYSTGLFVAAPWAAVASGIGSMLSDLALGVPVYALPTLIIKGLMGFVAALILKNGGILRFLIACAVGGAIMVVGYGLFEYVFLGGWSYIALTIIPNLIQWAGGVVGAVILYYPLKRIREVTP